MLFLAAARATNSDFIVEFVIYVCFLEAYEMTHPPRRNIQTLVEEWSSTLLIQLASEYPSITEGNHT